MTRTWRHAGIPVIDGHVHVNRFDLMTPGAQELIRQNPTFPLMQKFVASPEAFLEHMDRQGIEQSWLINYCAKEIMGYGWEVNDWVARYVEADPKRLVPIGGYDPKHDGDAFAAADRLHDLGIRAVKIHTAHQHRRPNDPELWSLYARMEQLGMPLIFHTGSSSFPGADNFFADPTPITNVCLSFPKLQVVIAHGGRPDQTADALEVLSICKNAWLDLSSCPPQRLRDYFGDLESLAPRTLWGSDWPGPGVPGMGKNVESFLALGLSKKANQMILHDNAASILPG